MRKNVREAESKEGYERVGRGLSERGRVKKGGGGGESGR